MSEDLQEQIKEDIESTKKDIRDYIEEAFNARKELDDLKKALTCDHDWQPFQNKLYKGQQCSKCNYIRDN